MTIWAIIPVKPLHLGKSRLASVLSDDDRYALNRCLYERTMTTLKAVTEIERILVISRDPQVLSMARSQGAITVQEGRGSFNLNAALEKATRVGLHYMVRSLLILPADLPLVNATDVQILASHAKDPPVFAIVPDRHCDGTNALLMNPAGLVHYAFGEGSFEQHCQLARQAKMRLEVVELPRLALDLDRPEDLNFLNKEMNLQAVC